VVEFDWARARVAAVQFARQSFPFLDEEDVAQETMVSLLTDRSTVNGPLAIRTVVQRRGVDMARRESGRSTDRQHVQLDTRLHIVDGAPRPEDVVHLEDLVAAALRNTSARHPETKERHARLIERVYIRGEKPGAVAKDEGISASELSRIVSAAKKRRHHVATR